MERDVKRAKGADELPLATRKESIISDSRMELLEEEIRAKDVIIARLTKEVRPQLRQKQIRQLVNIDFVRALEMLLCLFPASTCLSGSLISLCQFHTLTHCDFWPLLERRPATKARIAHSSARQEGVYPSSHYFFPHPHHHSIICLEPHISNPIPSFRGLKPDIGARKNTNDFWRLLKSTRMILPFVPGFFD